MLYLLRVDLKKLIHYRTFWVICGLYFITLGMTTASGMEFLKWMARTFDQFGGKLNINRIPLYHFPDVWQNLIWVSGLFKIILAILVVISITNEYAYRTIRQNIIDGLSRPQFLGSKIMVNALLALMSVGMVFMVALVAGLVYTPVLEFKYVFDGMGFLLAYMLEVFAFLSLALLIGIMVQRSGLSIVLLLLANMLEAIVRENIDEYVPWLIPFFPMESISNLVPMPFARYAFQEIQDSVSLVSVGIALAWTVLFNYFSYQKLMRSDL